MTLRDQSQGSQRTWRKAESHSTFTILPTLKLLDSAGEQNWKIMSKLDIYKMSAYFNLDIFFSCFHDMKLSLTKVSIVKGRNDGNILATIVQMPNT